MCRQFIKDRFTGHNKGKGERISTFETTATDTNLVKNIFVTVKNIIMRINIEASGLEWNVNSAFMWNKSSKAIALILDLAPT